MTAEATEEPVFVYSAGKDWVVWLLCTIIVFAAATYELLSSPQIGGAIFLYVVDILLIPWVLRSSTPRLRRAVFYENHATLQERHLQRDISYSQIAEVRITRQIPFISAPWMEVRLVGEGHPLAVVKNPVNRALGMNLGMWLRQKANLS